MKYSPIKIKWRARMVRYSWPVQAVVRVLQRPFDAEWTEDITSWPHCNTQAGCWMHLGRAGRWCGCRCPWCRRATVIRRGPFKIKQRSTE